MRSESVLSYLAGPADDPEHVKIGPRRLRCLAAAICGGLLVVTGCDRKAAARSAPPPPTVTVAHPVVRTVMEWDEYTGRMAAVREVDVRARVGGLLMSAPFKEGALVKAGDLLAEIDVRPYQAQLDAMVAQVAVAKAQVRLAEIDYQRIEGISADARSRTEFDTAGANLERARAALAGAEAQVAAAKLNVEWCRVEAPIDGRVSRKNVTEGNLISGADGQGTLLTTIASVDPIYCYVDVDEASALKYAELAREGRRISARQARIPIRLQLANETGFPHVGEVDFVDNRVDPDTGTIRGRGVFSNADGWLLPGLFARVRIPGSGRYDAVLVPDAAISNDQNAKLLMVVNAKNVVEARPVRLGALFGDLRAIVSGVGSEDRVIINGLMSARPGTTVTPVDGVISLESMSPEMTPTSAPAVAVPTMPAAPEGASR